MTDNEIISAMTAEIQKRLPNVSIGEDDAERNYTVGANVLERAFSKALSMGNLQKNIIEPCATVMTRRLRSARNLSAVRIETMNDGDRAFFIDYDHKLDDFVSASS